MSEAGRWLALAGGSPMLAIELAAGGSTAWLETLVARLANGGRIDPLALAGELEKAVKESKGKLALKAIVEALQKWLVDLTLVANGQSVRYFLPQQSTISSLAAMISAVKLIRFYREMVKRRQEAEQPLNARLFLEGIFLDYRALFAK